MAEITDRQVQERLGKSYALDRLWSETMGLESGDTKEKPLREVIAVLEASGTAYAVASAGDRATNTARPRSVLG